MDTFFSKPVIGPLVGGFVAEDAKLGWHMNFWIMFILSATTLVVGFVLTPETVSVHADPNMSVINYLINYPVCSCFATPSCQKPLQSVQ